MGFLTPSEMPMSFTGRALLWGANSNVLNPPNQGQSLGNRIVGKPLRVIARMIYQIAIAILAPFGALYHLSMAIINKQSAFNAPDDEVAKRHDRLVWEHFKASMHDISTTLSLSARTLFCFEPNSSVSSYLSSSLVQGPPLTSDEIMNDEFPYALILAKKLSHENHVIETEKQEEWKVRIMSTLPLMNEINNPSSNSRIEPVVKTHADNARDMARGFYRFDELVHRALWYRDFMHTLPSLDHVSVRVLCFNNSFHGTYGEK